MLQSFRAVSQHFIVKILLLLLAASFLLWGVGDFLKGGRRSQVVTFRGAEAITVKDWQQAIEKHAQYVQQALGRQITPQDLENFKQDPWILLGLVNGKAIQLIANQWGLEPDIHFAVAQIQTNPQFQNKDGHFDPSLLAQFLQQARLAEEGYITAVREEQGRDNLIALGYEPEEALPGLVSILQRYQKEERVADVFTIQRDAVSVPTADTTTLEAYYQAEEVRYRVPEQRTFRVALLKAENVPVPTVTDEEITKAYDKQKATLIRPEQRDLIHVVLPKESDAEAAMKKLQLSGNERVQAVEALTGKPYADSLMHDMTYDSLPEEFKEPIFAAAQDAVLRPIHTDLGWHIFVVAAIHPEEAMSLDKAKPMLMAGLKQEKAAGAFSDAVRNIEDAIAGGESFQVITERYHLSPFVAEKVTASGTRANGKEVALPTYMAKAWWEPILGQAFAATTDMPTELLALEPASTGLEAPQEGYALVHLETIMPSALQPFAEVRGRVEKDWREVAYEKAVQALVAEVQQQVEAQKPATEIAAGLRIAVKTDQTYQRPNEDARHADGSERLERAIFAITKPGQVSGLVEALQDATQIAVLKKIQPFAGAMTANAATDDTIQKAIEKLQSEVSGDALFHYLYRHFRIHAHGTEPVVTMLNGLFTQ